MCKDKNKIQILENTINELNAVIKLKNEEIIKLKKELTK